jgi:hypothetical protein
VIGMRPNILKVLNCTATLLTDIGLSSAFTYRSGERSPTAELPTTTTHKQASTHVSGAYMHHPHQQLCMARPVTLSRSIAALSSAHTAASAVHPLRDGSTSQGICNDAKCRPAFPLHCQTVARETSRAITSGLCTPLTTRPTSARTANTREGWSLTKQIVL